MVSDLNSQLDFSPNRTRATTFSDHRCLAVNRSTETAPQHRKSRANTQKAPKIVLSITANGIKLHFYVIYTSYT